MKYAVFFAATLAAFAQQAAPPPTDVSAASCYLDGHVTDRATGTPLAKATVILTVKINRVDYSAQVISGSDGRFQFAGLPPGKYRLRARAHNFQTLAYGARMPDHPGDVIALAPGEARRDLRLTMSRSGSISGRVLDEEGDPIAQIRIQVMIRGFLRGRSYLDEWHVTITDDRGEYSFSAGPGRYFIKASDMSMKRHLAASDVSASRPGQPAPEFGYGQQFYPGVSRSSEAVAITVVDQEIRGIDIRLPRVATASLRGHLTGLPENFGKANPVVTMIPEDTPDDAVSALGFAVLPDQTFIAPGIPTGSYLLDASANSRDGKLYHASQRVAVAAGGSEINVPLFPAVEVKGSVQVEGEGAGQYRPNRVRLEPGRQSEVKDDLTFVISNVTPGNWTPFVQPMPPGGYLKSVRVGDQEVLVEGITITSDAPRPVKIVISTRGASIRGKVENRGAKQPVVLAIPEGRRRDAFGFYKMTRANEEGEYVFGGLAPGKYRLLAFDWIEEDASQNPERWKPYEARGEIVEVAESEKATKALTMIVMEPEAHQ